MEQKAKSQSTLGLVLEWYQSGGRCRMLPSTWKGLFAGMACKRKQSTLAPGTEAPQLVMQQIA